MEKFREVRCRRCKLTFGSDPLYREHLLASKEHTACEQCYEDFLSLEALQKHVVQMHPAEQNLICKCGMKFVRASGLVAHLDERMCIGAPQMDLEMVRIEAALQKSTLDQAKEPSNMSGAVQHEPSMANLQDPVDPDDDLILFLDRPPDNGLNPDNDWSTAQMYSHLLAEVAESEPEDQITLRSTAEDQVAIESPTDTQPSIFGTNSTFGQPVLPVFESNIQTLLAPARAGEDARREAAAAAENKAQEDVDEWAPAVVSAPVETPLLTKQGVMDLIEHERRLKVERDKQNPFHPSCPEFNAGKYWNGILKFYKCPYSRCGKSKSSIDAFITHLLSPAHCGEEITCDVCLRIYPSPTAFAAHFEAQGKRCRAKDLGDDVISPLTGGVIRVVGEHKDYTPVYGAWTEEAKGDQAAQLAIHEENERKKLERRAEEEARWAQLHPKW